MADYFYFYSSRFFDYFIQHCTSVPVATRTTTKSTTTGFLVTWSLPGMGCDLPGHVRLITCSGEHGPAVHELDQRQQHEVKKSLKYADITAVVDFIPVATVFVDK